MTSVFAPVRNGWTRMAALGAGLVVLAACGEGDAPANQAGGGAAPPPPAVTVAEVSEAPVTPSFDFLGRVTAIDTVDVRARVEGFLDKRNFTEGDDVKAGDVLFVIEQEPYQIALDQRRSELARAEADARNAQLQLDRGLELQRNRNIPESTVDDRRTAKIVADASVLEAQAAVRDAEIDLSYTEIKAPIDGRIGRSAYSVGNLVGPSSDILATVVSQDPVYVTFPVSSRQVLDVRRQEIEAGATQKLVAHVRLPDGTEYPDAGEINFLDIRVNQETDTVDVRATFANPDRLLFPGQFVNVVVEQGEPVTRVTVPAAAVQIGQGGRSVLVVKDDNVVEARQIVAGEQIGRNLVVQDGLRAGERVIVEGMQKARPGSPVTPTPQQAPQGA
ncbi:efflux RND transporter periplasmic adaptor subunit [Marinivivus vitaminiproducens]|uniref:efflux RND transporter periplasmic adaptor subunit n=1 Tax=Marinivivus vitaminiproducens TaxID=3035935 RepID=UPI0027A4ACF8|nr:efflux RND transporter periplasmic adaptor subunit [Geminicoccaceae bacterium SCSIO 64248]